MGKGIVAIKVGDLDHAGRHDFAQPRLPAVPQGQASLNVRVAQVQDLTTFMDTLMVLHHVGPLNVIRLQPFPGRRSQPDGRFGASGWREFPDLIPNHGRTA